MNKNKNKHDNDLENHTVREPSTPEAILRMLAREMYSDILMYRYVDPETQRTFRIRHFPEKTDNPWFLEELIPKGILDRLSFQIAWKRLFERIRKRATPNTFVRTFHALNKDPERFELMCTGFGYGKASFFYPSKRVCAEVIARHLADDTWYVSYDPEKVGHQMTRLEHLTSLHKAVEIWRQILEGFEGAATLPGVFRYCHGVRGEYWTEQTCKEILAFLNHPTREKWMTLALVFITYQTPLGMAWTEFCYRTGRDPNALPDTQSLKRAIRFAVLRDYNKAKRKYESLQQELREACDANKPCRPVPPPPPVPNR